MGGGAEPELGEIIGGQDQKNFFHNRGANGFAIAFCVVLQLYSNETAPKVPFLVNFRKNSIFLCWFHYCNHVYKKKKPIGLSKLYDESVPFPK